MKTSRRELIKKGLWYFLFNAILMLLIATRYFKYFSEVESFITIFYLTIATVSHFIALPFLFFLLYLPLVLVYPNRRAAWIWAGILTALSVFLLVLDTIIFNLYRMHFNLFILGLLFGGGAGQIFEFSILQFVLGIGILLIFIAMFLYAAYSFFSWKRVENFRKGWLIFGSVVTMMLASHFIHAWADAASYLPITKSSRYYPLYFPTTANSLIFKLGLVDEEESKRNRLMFSEHRGNDLNYPKQPLVFNDGSQQNIILILIDSWHFQAFDSLTTPNIYNFSKKGEIYTHHYSGSNGTRTGVFSLFYGIPGIYWDAVLASQTRPLLVDRMEESDYAIHTFPSATITNPPFNRTVFANLDIRVDTEGSQAYSRDIQITEDWLHQSSMLQADSLNNPFFTFLFYDATHSIQHPPDYKGPYSPQWDYPRYELLNNNTDPTLFFNLYRNTVHFVDSLVGVVLADLEVKGFLENSWVIITGDHGQEFNDNGKNYWGHNGNYSAAQMQTPLVVYKPEGKHAVYNHWTNHLDISPTIMSELFGCENNISDYSAGKHLNDTTLREWMLVGSPDNYAILQPNRITSIYFNGTFDITDARLNPIKGAKLQSDTINHILRICNTFYR